MAVKKIKVGAHSSKLW